MMTTNKTSTPSAATKTSSRSNSRAVVNARNEILGDLIEDHKRVKKAYKEFEKLDIESDEQRCQEIVKQVLQELSLHAAIEEELLYPAGRAALSDDALIDEAEVEHETVHALINQLESMKPSDDKYAARFTVLCEYVLHHVKEEEKEMFPQLEKARLDWETMAAQVRERRGTMMNSSSAQHKEEMDDAMSESAEGGMTAALDKAQSKAKSQGNASRKSASKKVEA
jgi:hemerythrin superfamily protein